MKPIVHTRDLRKVFRRPQRRPGIAGALRALLSPVYAETVAVSNVSMDVTAGELVGYIGPNGAGKSTTIKMLTGILVPSSGVVEVAGFVPWRRRSENARNIGVVFGQRSQLYWDLPLRESFDLLRAIYDIPRRRYLENLHEFIEILEMDDFLDTPVRQLSLGQRMRGDFAAALLHDPRIVYLDEPTIGLDVVAKEAIREFILRINQQRATTVLLTTHDLADVERLCRRIVIIDRGSLLYDGTVEELKDAYGQTRRLTVVFAEPQREPAIEGATLEHVERNVARFAFERATISADRLIAAVAARYPVQDVSIEEPDLEGIIRRIYLEGISPPEVLRS
ncbi:ATP-binding cassette domain-containing protein [bacterium]|nr:MAG: ATP-binding cassette domain-containing protein [bacterium]